MIQLIAGEKGKGKTKYLLENVNQTLKFAQGSIVYIDKNTKHMYELNNKVRLINLSDFPVGNSNELICFICGILSRDHDIEYIYLDSFLTLANIDGDDADAVVDAISKLNEIGNKYDLTFVITISKNLSDLPEIKDAQILVSL